MTGVDFVQGWAAEFPDPAAPTCGGCGIGTAGGQCGRCGERADAVSVSWLAAAPDITAADMFPVMAAGGWGPPGKCWGCGRTYCIGSGCPARGLA